MFGLLLVLLCLPGLLRGDLVFRCPSCTAEDQDGCPEVTLCAQMVREPGCGCCPVCARLEGEPCGVYTPRCSAGLRCSPGLDAQFPLQQLIRGFGRCTRSLEQDQGLDRGLDRGLDLGLDLLPTNEVKRPLLDPWNRQEKTRLQTQNELRTRMRSGLSDERVQREPPSSCQQELDMVLEEISRMTSEDNRGPLENLYGLKFPNCDRHGLYNLKQCNMSTHGQRGECWCVDPLTGVQIPETPRVRGDPNCNHLQEALRAPPTTAR